MLTILLLAASASEQAVAAGALRVVNGIEFVRIPAGRFITGDASIPASLPLREHVLPVFSISRCEITTEQFCNFLNGSGYAFRAHPQLRRTPSGWVPDKRRNDLPIAGVNFSVAEAFCEWLSKTSGVHARLPSEIEWERAARSGIHQAPYANGWGPPDAFAVYNANGPARTASRRCNPYGLYDMCGNLYEWCTADAAVPDNHATARGGAWSEKDPLFLHVAKRTFFPREYTGRDIGFRVVTEPLK